MRELHRLPPQTTSGFQPAPRHYPLYRQAAFANIVTAVYSAMLIESRDDGDKARFRKAAERGLWELSDAGKAQVDAIKEAFAAK